MDTGDTRRVSEIRDTVDTGDTVKIRGIRGHERGGPCNPHTPFFLPVENGAMFAYGKKMYLLGQI